MPGGTSVGYYPAPPSGSATYDGAVVIVFTKLFSTWIKQSGAWQTANDSWVRINDAWKKIQQGWIKQNGVWNPITSPNRLIWNHTTITPPTASLRINLVIAANTNNYDLAANLVGTAYYPGCSIVTLTVNSGVVVGSTSVLTPAINIHGLTNGDQFELINNGTIKGAGGQGGTAGSYTCPTSYTTGKYGYTTYTYSYAPKGTSNVVTNPGVSIPGGPGFRGGDALQINYLTALVNNGTIAGGGGGGGGGGGPTGGQGGGGAGAIVGTGANNGTATTGGAGSGYGGQGGALGQPGTAGTNNSGGSGGGVGGAAGAAIVNSINVQYLVTGTIIGPTS